jgi:fumarylacetoacetate (FAA) hydrolase
MKLCTYRIGSNSRAGIVAAGKVFKTNYNSMNDLLIDCQNDFSKIIIKDNGTPLESLTLLACLPHPNSLRDFYAFEDHVKNARKKRGGGDVPPEWYEFPAFYFANHNAIVAPFANVKRPSGTTQLDYELEVACIIGKSGVDIPASEAEKHIAGYTIMNDWSARDVQMKEMKVGLGPAKGKDFATTFGSLLVTPDELADKKINGRLSLEMEVRVNGKRYGGGNFNSIHYTFAQMIERASHNCRLSAGDVIGSGTIGTGCILELDNEKFPYLKTGDVVEMEVECLGTIRNKVVA